VDFAALSDKNVTEVKSYSDYHGRYIHCLSKKTKTKGNKIYTENYIKNSPDSDWE